VIIFFDLAVVREDILGKNQIAHCATWLIKMRHKVAKKEPYAPSGRLSIGMDYMGAIAPAPSGTLFFFTSIDKITTR